tara:strand:+ start:258 stop:596 length:339 start_codon:yes stop_codon:yes gene_type:complete
VTPQCDSLYTLSVALQEIYKQMPTSNWWETIPDRQLEDILDAFDQIQDDNWWTLTPEEERMATAAADEAARRYYQLRNHMDTDVVPTPENRDINPRSHKRRRLRGGRRKRTS